MQIIHERLDDIPLILSYLIKNKVNVHMDKHLKNHGNQNSLSNGEVAIIWLAYILSQGDHRKAHVVDWVSQHQITLSACLEKHVDVNNFTDDRLTRLLHRCSLEQCWVPLENDLAKNTLALIPIEHVLEPYFEKGAENIIKGIFKLDGTSISGHHEVSEEGLMQYGYSKDRRPDLAQLKLMNCVEGLTGCPIMSDIDRGNLNDECMYEPILNRMRDNSSTKGFLYCGDSKMSFNKIRINIVSNNEFYLCPLELSNKKNKALFHQEWVSMALDSSKELVNVYDEEKIIAYGYELEREVQDPTGHLKWNERVLLVKSLGYFESEKVRFDKSLIKLKEEIFKKTSKYCKNPEEANKHLDASVEAIFIKSKISKNFFEIEYEIEERVKKYNRTETYKGVKRNGSYEIKDYKSRIKKITILEEKRKEFLDKLGWRPYVTNVPKNILSFSNAYSYYRKTQHVIESGFHMIKADPLGIRPVFVWREDQIKGLVRFLTLGVYFLKLMSLELMLSLKKNNEEIMGLTAGQPKRKTRSPTTVSVLSYFCRRGLNLSCIKVDKEWQIATTPLPDLCLKILALLGLTRDVYERIQKWHVTNSRLINSKIKCAN